MSRFSRVLFAWSIALALAFVPATPARAQADEVLPDDMGYDAGSSKPSLRVIEFSDFSCAYCATFATQTWPKLEAEFVATHRVRWTFVPFRMIGMRYGDEAAEAAACVASPDKFYPMHDLLFAGQHEWSSAATPERVMRDYAVRLQMDTTKFLRCIRSRRMRDRIADNTSQARAMGARGTPTFFIDGKRYEGALPYERFRELILRALASTSARK